MSSETLKWLIGTLIAITGVVIAYLQYRRQALAPPPVSRSAPEDTLTPKAPLRSIAAKVTITGQGQHANGLRAKIVYKVAGSIDVSCNAPIFHSPYSLGTGRVDEDASWSILSNELNVKIGDCLWLCAEYTSTELLHYVNAKLDFNPALKNVAGFLSLRPKSNYGVVGISVMKRGSWSAIVKELYKHIYIGIAPTDDRLAKAVWVPDVFRGITINHFNKNERYRLHAIAWVSPKTEQRGRLVLESLARNEMARLLAEFPVDL